MNIGVLDEDSDEAEANSKGSGAATGERQATAQATAQAPQGNSAAKAATSSTTSEVDPENEELELDDEDLLRMHINETMRQAREGFSLNQSPRCQVNHPINYSIFKNTPFTSGGALIFQLKSREFN